MDFRSIYQHGFVRVAACTGGVAIADPPVNAELVLRSARECSEEGVVVALFPEMTLTGYSVEDLVLQDAVLDDVERSLATVVEGSADLLPLIVFGAPLRHRNRIYNCAVVVHRGRVLGVVPKSYPPTYREFYEGRQLASGVGERGEIRVGGAEVPFGTDLLFAADDVPGLVVHAEVCEDMWIPVPPSAEAALAGATLLLNLSGSPITVGRAEDRKLLCRSASSRCLAAYVYSAAGQGESSTDLAWDGQTTIYENGVLLAETERFAGGDRRAVADVDLDLLLQERRRMGTFDDNRRAHADRTGAFRRVGFTLDPPEGDLGLRRRVERYPFVPSDVDRLNLDCYEAYNIQVAGLQQRLRAIGDPKVVIGVSGGLDSTQALLVAAQAMDRAGRPRSDILGFTLPGFATSEGTKTNAHRLMDALGITAGEIDIQPSAKLMLEQIEHPFAKGEEVYDVTFENVQAGLRTDYLFRIANQRGGIVLGTGDLSELALGWATYGVGDQMSHYNVNGGVPKTFIQHLIRWVINSEQFEHGGQRDARLDPRHRDQPRARAGRGAAVDGVPDRPLRAARLLALLHAALRLPALEDRLHGVARVARRRRGHVAAELPRRQARRLRPAGDPPLARVLLQAVLRLRPVQALGAAERAEGLGRRIAVAAWRLAGALGRVGRRLAPRPRAVGLGLIGERAVGDGGQVGVHVPGHHLERRPRPLGLDVRDGVGGHADLVAAHVGVQRGVLDALLRDLAAEDQALDLFDLQQMVDGGLVEDRVAALRDERHSRVWQQRLDEVRPAAVERAADQVLARVLPVLVVVVDVDRQGVVGARGAVAQLDHLRQLLRDRIGELLGVLMVVGVEHVDDDESGPGHLGAAT